MSQDAKRSNELMLGICYQLNTEHEGDEGPSIQGKVDRAGKERTGWVCVKVKVEG